MKRCSAFGAVALLLGGCLHESEEAAVIPRAVLAVRENYAQDCAPDLPKFGKNLIQTGDLNGDGALDYVVSAFSYECRHDMPYCGSGGCEVEVFLSAPGGIVEQRYSGNLMEPPHVSGKLLVSGHGEEKLRFDLNKLEFVPDR